MAAIVLVVPDEPSVRKLLKRIFENDGIPVIEATSAPQALKLYAEYINEIGVAICGLRLSGLGDETFVKVLRTLDPACRVFIFSAIHPAFQLPEGVQVFAKPNDLCQAVRDEILGG